MAWHRRTRPGAGGARGAGEEGGTAGDQQEEGARAIVGVVTGLVPSARRQGRVELAVDGRAAATVSLEILDRFALRVGLVLDAVVGAALAEAVAELGTYDRALGLLAAQGRSARDLRQRLVRGGEAPVHADAAVARLRDAGFLDDAAYARQVARSRVTGRGESRRRVAQTLARKGVERTVVDEAVAEVFEDEAVDEEALVEQAARKKLRTLAGEEPAVQRRRLRGFLARRGHDGDVIRRVVARLVGARDDDASEAADADGSSPSDASG